MLRQLIRAVAWRALTAGFWLGVVEFKSFVEAVALGRQPEAVGVELVASRQPTRLEHVL